MNVTDNLFDGKRFTNKIFYSKEVKSYVRFGRTFSNTCHKCVFEKRAGNCNADFKFDCFPYHKFTRVLL